MIREREKEGRAGESQYQSSSHSLFLISLNLTASCTFFLFLSCTPFSSFLSFSGFIFFHLALIGDVSQSQQANSTGCGHKLQHRDKDGEKGKERAKREEKALKISALQGLSSTNPVTCPPTEYFYLLLFFFLLFFFFWTTNRFDQNA